MVKVDYMEWFWMRWLRNLKDNCQKWNFSKTVMRQFQQIVMYSKLEYAPLTNSGRESEFAKLDICIVASGGSTTFKRIRVKTLWPQIVCLLIRPFPSWVALKNNKYGSGLEHRRMWPLRPTTYRLWKCPKKLALLKKEELKRKKTQRTMKLLDTCENIGWYTDLWRRNWSLRLVI